MDELACPNCGEDRMDRFGFLGYGLMCRTCGHEFGVMPDPHAVMPPRYWDMIETFRALQSQPYQYHRTAAKAHRMLWELYTSGFASFS